MQSRAQIKQRSKKLLQGNWGKAVTMSLMNILMLIIWLCVSTAMMINNAFILGFTFFWLFIPVIIMVSAGVQFVFRDWVREGQIADDWFRQIWQVVADHRLAGKVIRVAFADGIFSALWEIIFVIPGIVKEFEYSQALYIMKDHYDRGEEISARQCLKESSLMMNGYKEDFFIFNCSYFGWQILGMLPLLIGLLWSISYMEMGLLIFYDDLSREHSYQRGIIFYPDGNSQLTNIKINNKLLTIANWIAIGFIVFISVLGNVLSVLVPGVNTVVKNDTYILQMKNQYGIKQSCYVMFYSDDDIDSYVILPKGAGQKGEKIVKELEEERYDSPIEFGEYLKEFHNKGFEYDASGDTLELKLGKKEISMSDMKVTDQGQKITGKYKNKVLNEHGKVIMTRLDD